MGRGDTSFGWTWKEPRWTRRKGSGRNVQGHTTRCGCPRTPYCFAEVMTISVQASERVSVGVRSCPLPASLPILLGNNQEETPGVSWLLHTFFTHRGALAHREHFFAALILMEKVVSDGGRNSGDRWEVPEGGELSNVFAHEKLWTCHQKSQEK